MKGNFPFKYHVLYTAMPFMLIVITSVCLTTKPNICYNCVKNDPCDVIK